MAETTWISTIIQGGALALLTAVLYWEFLNRKADRDSREKFAKADIESREKLSACLTKLASGVAEFRSNCGNTQIAFADSAKEMTIACQNISNETSRLSNETTRLSAETDRFIESNQKITSP